jgi:hypothetical protein
MDAQRSTKIDSYQKDSFKKERVDYETLVPIAKVYFY